VFFALRRLGRRELSEYQHNRVRSRGAHAAPQGQGPVRPVSVSQGRRKPKRSGGVWRVVFIVSGFDPSKEPTRDEGTDID